MLSPRMGGGASIVSLSAEDLGAEVGKLGKAYEPVKQDIVDSGISGDILFDCVKDDEAEFKLFVSELGVTSRIHQTKLHKEYIKLLSSEATKAESRRLWVSIFVRTS